jgi:prepilin-type processing-associated H-X9-DG protein
MKTKKKFTRLDLIVLVLIIVMLLMIIWPATSIPRKVESRIVCNSYLKGLGFALQIYLDDNQNYPELPGNGPWSKDLGFAYDTPAPDFQGKHSNTTRTISASWYLLVKYAGVLPAHFVCSETKQSIFNGKNSQNLKMQQLWDFGSDPFEHVSYAMHNPYGKYPANRNKPSEFAIAADMNPWLKGGDFVEPGKNEGVPPKIISFQNEETYMKGNSINHTEYGGKFLFWKYTKHSTVGLGQNVLYIDGHVKFEAYPNCGIKKDNIYTFWSNDIDPNKQDIQGGTNPKERNLENDAKSEEDFFLAL